jgi:Flp pilus assembly protein TadB
MDSDAGGWLWLVIDVILVAALAFALLYGTMMWRARRRNPVLEQVSEQATERLYERAAEDERKQTAEGDRKTAA